MEPVKIYTLANCDRCRQAVRWLRARGTEYEERAIRETPPTLAELRTMLAAYDGELRRLFNTSGRDYREQQFGEKLPGMTEAEALRLLSQNGNLVKRPFLVGRNVAMVGFDPDAWARVLDAAEI